MFADWGYFDNKAYYVLKIMSQRSHSMTSMCCYRFLATKNRSADTLVASLLLIQCITDSNLIAACPLPFSDSNLIFIPPPGGFV